MSKGKRGAPAPRPRSGFVTEEMRHTERLTLRLPPETMAVLREAAAGQEMGLGEYVTRLLDTIRQHPEVPCGTLLEDVRGPFT